MKAKITIVIVALVLIGLIAVSLNKTPETPVAPATPAENSYTLAEVAKHKDSTSCWSAVNGKVYDLTSWIGQHPGGPEAIKSICGLDGSEAFNGQHGGMQKQADILATFYIGELAK